MQCDGKAERRSGNVVKLDSCTDPLELRHYQWDLQVQSTAERCGLALIDIPRAVAD